MCTFDKHLEGLRSTELNNQKHQQTKFCRWRSLFSIWGLLIYLNIFPKKRKIIDSLTKLTSYVTVLEPSNFCFHFMKLNFAICISRPKNNSVAANSQPKKLLNNALKTTTYWQLPQHLRPPFSIFLFLNLCYFGLCYFFWKKQLCVWWNCLFPAHTNHFSRKFAFNVPKNRLTPTHK